MASRVAALSASVERGTALALEIHARPGAHRVVVRDAWIDAGGLVLRRPGERIEVPAGRCEVRVHNARWRRRRPPNHWRVLPPAILGAGVTRGVAIESGATVAMVDGELEDVGHDQASFRVPAERRMRWVPRGGRAHIHLMS